VTNEDLSNWGGLDESKLGFSTPDYILGELKLAITEVLEKQAALLKKIRK
jgi:hypothetical protein